MVAEDEEPRRPDEGAARGLRAFGPRNHLLPRRPGKDEAANPRRIARNRLAPIALAHAEPDVEGRAHLDAIRGRLDPEVVGVKGGGVEDGEHREVEAAQEHGDPGTVSTGGGV